MTYTFLTMMQFPVYPVKALPSACPRCDRIFGTHNYREPRSLDRQDITVIICECGYFDRAINTNVCRWYHSYRSSRMACPQWGHMIILILLLRIKNSVNRHSSKSSEPRNFPIVSFMYCANALHIDETRLSLVVNPDSKREVIRLRRLSKVR